MFLMHKFYATGDHHSFILYYYFIINNINIIAIRIFELSVLATKRRRILLYKCFEILSRVEVTRH
jgi:hypothetical protein